MAQRRGFAQVFSLVFLVAALIAGLWLVQNRTNLFSIASSSLGGPAYINAETVCSSPDPYNPKNHLDVTITGYVPTPPPEEDGIWGTLTDETTKQTVIFSYAYRWDNLAYIAHGYANSLRDKGTITLRGDGSDYTIKIFYAPYTEGIPTLTNPITQTIFNQVCSFCPDSPCAVDVNSDNRVNILDIAKISGCFNQKVSDLLAAGGGNCSTLEDVNRDGIIDLGDLNCAKNFFGQFCSQPTPTPTPVTCTACAADINKDKTVNILDLSKIAVCLGKVVQASTAGGATCSSNLDLNGNGVVDQADLDCAKSHFGEKCSP